jgi:hypothetical protein
MTWDGENISWDILAEQNPDDVQIRTGALFNHDISLYSLTCLGQEILISIKERFISGDSSSGKTLIQDLGAYSRISILKYLTHGKDIPLSGELVRPSDLPGGEIFSKGTHVLPLHKIAEQFGSNYDLFLEKGNKLGATHLDYGDISLMLFPLPRIPTALIVWSGDDEFPSRASLLFDSTCLSHLSTDILWSTAMMSTEMMLL